MSPTPPTSGRQQPLRRSRRPFTNWQPQTYRSASTFACQPLDRRWAPPDLTLGFVSGAWQLGVLSLSALLVMISCWMAFRVRTECGVRTLRGGLCERPTRGILFGCRQNHHWEKVLSWSAYLGVAQLAAKLNLRLTAFGTLGPTYRSSPQQSQPADVMRNETLPCSTCPWYRHWRRLSAPTSPRSRSTETSTSA